MTKYDFAPYAEDGVEPNGPTARWRYPIVSNPHPRWYYITAVVVGPARGDGSQLYQSLMPTAEELEAIGSFHAEYCDHWYGPAGTGWRGRVMEQRPFDIDGGANGRVLIKHLNGGWGYHMRTWQYGAFWVPESRSEPMTLVDVLDLASGHGGEPSARWLKWKADHTEVFSRAQRDGVDALARWTR